MINEIQALLDRAVARKRSPTEEEALPLMLMRDIDTQLGGLLPKELAAIIVATGGKADPSQSIATLYQKAHKAVCTALDVKPFKDDYSILQHSPLRDHFKQTDEEPTMATTIKKRTAEKTASKKIAAKKTSARKATAQKATAQKATSTARISNKLYTLVYRKKLDTVSDAVSPQAFAILECLKAAGGKNVPKSDLLGCMEKKVETRQPIGRILSFYQKSLINEGYISVS